jgi:5-keto 4-deoxyuronate isomerase
LRSDFFCERRELGVLNVGGAGTVTVDGAVSNWASSIACMCRVAARVWSFASDEGASPAAFYLLSYPAHTEYPTKMVKFKELEAGAVHLGSEETCNKRSIYKAIFPRRHPQLPAGDGLYAAGAGIELEHDASAYAYATQRGVFLLRRGLGAEGRCI